MKTKKNQNLDVLPDVEYLTRKESASFLRLSISSFDKIKDIEFIKFGKKKVFSIDSLRRYAEKHTIGAEDGK